MNEDNNTVDNNDALENNNAVNQPAETTNTSTTPADPTLQAPSVETVDINPQSAETPFYQSVPSSVPQETSVTNSSEIIDEIDPTPPHNYSKSYVLIAGIAAYALAVVATLLAFATDSYDVASSLAGIVQLSSILGSLLIGSAVASIVYRANKDGSSMNTLVKIGIILLVLSIIGGIFTMVTGLILIIVGSRKPTTEVKNTSKAARIVLTIIAFIGAGLSSFVVGFLLLLIVSQRVCDLSSSKCY